MQHDRTLQLVEVSDRPGPDVHGIRPTPDRWQLAVGVYSAHRADYPELSHPRLSRLFDALEQRADTKRLRLTYETFFASQLTINFASEGRKLLVAPMKPIKGNAADFVAMDGRTVASAIPYAGGALGEIIGAVIPNQRVDRVTDFLQQLEKRMEGLERRFAPNNRFSMDLLQRLMSDEPSQRVSQGSDSAQQR
jgi:hypothetical protein